MQKKSMEEAKNAIKARVQEYINHTGDAASVRDFLIKAGLSPSFITGIGRGIGRDAKQKIQKAYTSLNVDWLDTGNGSMLVESTPRVEIESNVSPVRTGDLQWMEIPLVPYKACAGVLDGFGDPVWQEDKQTMQVLVDQRLHGDYVIYEVYGDSMNDGSAQAFLEGDFLLCRLLPQSDWQYGIKKRTATYCVIATHTEGIVLKQVTYHDKAAGIITCHSLNPDYSDYDLKLSEVQALFYVERLAQREL